MQTNYTRTRVVVFCGALFLFAGQLFAAEKNAPMVARVVTVNGNVTASGHPLIPGDKLVAGETIETLEGASAKIILYDRSVIDIGPSSSFRVKEVHETEGTPNIETELDWGTVRSSIQKKIGKRSKFILHTKASVLAVRGTEFVVNVDRKSDSSLIEKVTVSDGIVNVTSAGQKDVSLDAGKQIIQEASLQNKDWIVASALKVTELTPTAVNDIIAHATVVDHTFNQAVIVAAATGNSKGFSGGSTLAALGGNFTPPPPSRPNGPRPPGDLSRPDNPTGLGINDIQRETPDISGGRNVTVTATFVP